MKAALTFILTVISGLAMAAPPVWYSQSNGPAGAELEPYFKGVSQTYFVSDVKSEQRAQDEACSDAMRDIAKYFGVNVQVETNVSIGSVNGSKDIRYSEKRAEQAGLKLFGLKPEKTEIEKLGASHLRGYCLIVLRPEAKAHIQKEIKRNQKIYDQEIESLQNALITKDIDVAKIHADTLQALPLLSKDDRLPPLLKQLQTALKGVLDVSLKLNKKNYNVRDEIKFFVALNQNANIYVLMDTGADWQVVYPNTAHRLPLVKSGIIEMPTERMKDEGVVPVIFKEMFNKKIKIHLIAAKDNLLLDHYSETSGVFDYLSYGGKWENNIKNCVVKKRCVEQIVPVIISNPLKDIIVSLQGDENWVRPLRRQLRKRGVRVGRKGNCRLNLNISSKDIYSQRLNMKLNQLSINAGLEMNNQQIKQITLKRNNVIGMDQSQARETSMSVLAEKVHNALVFVER